jgi:hypothetical protein
LNLWHEDPVIFLLRLHMRLSLDWGPNVDACALSIHDLLNWW